MTPQSAADTLYPGGPSTFLGNEEPTLNFQQAIKDMNLNDKEKALYQRHLTNLYGPGGVDNPDGSRSTLFQSTITEGDKTYVVPTVFDGKILKGKELFDRLDKEGLDKFPSYDSVEEAEARYDKMHSYMERDTAQFLKGRRQ